MESKLVTVTTAREVLVISYVTYVTKQVRGKQGSKGGNSLTVNCYLGKEGYQGGKGSKGRRSCCE